MTNNNWIETEFDKKFRKESFHGYAWAFDRKELLDFISNLLTKKDQEHKAELEMIKGEIESFEVYKDTLTT